MSVQTIQAQHRESLVQSWGVEIGSRILEIGCGQGDMTAALAKAVGPTGRITAVDIASPEYGAPQTLREATDELKASDLGERIDFWFRFDVLEPSNAFQSDAFDVVVLAHSLWYFASPEQLERTLATVRPWAKRLFIAEWDLTPRSLSQVAHLLAVLIQGQVEAFKSVSEANVRTPLSKAQVTAIARKAGWTITQEAVVDSEQMQDADWEIRQCLSSGAREAEAIDLSPRFQALIDGEIDILRSLSSDGGNRPLTSYTLVAERRTAAEA